MITYDKLADILKERKMQWKDLCKGGLSINTPAKFSHNRTMNTENIDKVCSFLQVQPGDLMEWIPDADYEKQQKEKQTEKEASIQAQIDALKKQLEEVRGNK